MFVWTLANDNDDDGCYDYYYHHYYYCNNVYIHNMLVCCCLVWFGQSRVESMIIMIIPYPTIIISKFVSDEVWLPSWLLFMISQPQQHNTTLMIKTIIIIPKTYFISFLHLDYEKKRKKQEKNVESKTHKIYGIKCIVDVFMSGDVRRLERKRRTSSTFSPQSPPVTINNTDGQDCY